MYIVYTQTLHVWKLCCLKKRPQVRQYSMECSGSSSAPPLRGLCASQRSLIRTRHTFSPHLMYIITFVWIQKIGHTELSALLPPSILQKPSSGALWRCAGHPALQNDEDGHRHASPGDPTEGARWKRPRGEKRAESRCRRRSPSDIAPFAVSLFLLASCYY